MHACSCVQKLSASCPNFILVWHRIIIIYWLHHPFLHALRYHQLTTSRQKSLINWSESWNQLASSHGEKHLKPGIVVPSFIHLFIAYFGQISVALKMTTNITEHNQLTANPSLYHRKLQTVNWFIIIVQLRWWYLHVCEGRALSLIDNMYTKIHIVCSLQLSFQCKFNT